MIDGLATGCDWRMTYHDQPVQTPRLYERAEGARSKYRIFESLVLDVSLSLLPTPKSLFQHAIMANLLFDSNGSVDAIPISLQVVVGLIVISILAVVYSFLTADRPIAGLPVLTVDGLKPQISWYTKGNETLAEGYKKYTGRPFQVATGTGYVHQNCSTSLATPLLT